MNNQQAIDRLVKHLECGWSEETVEAIISKTDSRNGNPEQLSTKQS